MTMVKRMCDRQGCLNWGVVEVTMDHDDGSQSTMVLCQTDLDAIQQVAGEQRIPVVDNRDGQR